MVFVDISVEREASEGFPPVVGLRPRPLADFARTGHYLMAASHPTPDRCPKAALLYLALDFFSLSALDPQEVRKAALKELGSSSAPHCGARAAVIPVQMELWASLPGRS